MVELVAKSIPVRKAKIIAVANQKGGVGKTTTAVNLAAAMAVAERRILLVDFDPQSNATTGAGTKDLDGTGIYSALVKEQDARDLVKDTEIEFLKVIPATIDLIGAELELVDDEHREYRLKEALESVRGDFDYIVIDCPPSLSLLTLNALTACDTVLVPLQCEYYALEGISQIMNTIELIKGRFNEGLELEGVLLTMYDGRNNLSHQVADEVRTHLGDSTYETVIPRNIRLSESPSFGKPIVLYDVYSKGAVSYLDLAREVITKNEKL